MKKNLRNILVLSLALITTAASAQDWNVDSRTRVDKSGEDGKFLTEQRATIGATWGADEDWGIHVSSDLNYCFGDIDGDGNIVDRDAFSAAIYEAYASTDLMGYAVLTAGRTALDYGSGAIMSSSQWTARRTTHDGFRFDLTGIEMADITLGIANRNWGVADDEDGTSNETKASTLFLNVNKADGDWSANLLYMKSTGTFGGVDADDQTAMGIDLSYDMMGGDLSLNVSYNTYEGSYDLYYDEYDDVWYAVEEGDEDMMSIGATYNISEQLSVTANQTTYGENGFDVIGTDMFDGWNGGGIGYLNADDQDRNLGITYTMGDFNLGATMHQITNTGDDVAGSTTNADYARDVMDISLGYTMSDNANLSLRYATDKGAVLADDDDTYMWITLNIRP